MHRRSQWLWLCLMTALLAIPAVRAEVVSEILDSPRFGALAIQRTADEEPKGVVLLMSGAGGWNADLTAVARAVAELDYVVAGISLEDYLIRVDRSDVACADPSSDLEQLNRLLEQRYPLATHLPPILLGYGAGAALMYTALAQAPADRFHAGLAVDFCPELPLRKPFCKSSVNLESTALPDGKRILLKPIVRMPTTWFVFQNRPACDAGAAAQFVQSIALARLAEIAGDSGAKSGLPQISALLQWLDPGIVRQVQPDGDISGVPLTEVLVASGPHRRQLAVMLSGDGGWALLDRAVTAELAKNGLPTVGWDSLSYFWKARQPDQVALDLERVLRHYLNAWNKDRIVLIGYSFGADALPAVVSRLPKDLRDRIDLVTFLGLSDFASFEFHLNDWISDDPNPGDQPVRPELEKLSGIKRLCIYGAAEEDATCPKFAELGIIIEQMPGDHHFDDDYQGVAQRILDQLPPPRPAPP